LNLGNSLNVKTSIILEGLPVFMRYQVKSNQR